MENLIVKCLIVLKSIFDYEYESGFEFKCIDKETKPEEYIIFKDHILPLLTDEGITRTSIQMESLDHAIDYIQENYNEVYEDLENLQIKYDNLLIHLNAIYNLLCKDGINSKKIAKDVIKKILDEENK